VPVFASFTLAFVLQLRKKCRKTSVRVRNTCQIQYTYYQNIHILENLHTHTHTHTHTHYKTHRYTHTHTLQNNIKPPQCKLKQTQYKIYPNESHNIIKYPQYKVTLMYTAPLHKNFTITHFPPFYTSHHFTY
jgi:hypothetical protein